MSTQMQTAVIDHGPSIGTRWDTPHPAPTLGALVQVARSAMQGGSDWSDVAERVARDLRSCLPTADELLTIDQQLGEPGPLHSHLLHAEPDGTLSVVALVMRPGQGTPIHDHVTWCVSAVLEGIEHEELFSLEEETQTLIRRGTADNPRGDVNGFAPPGDIHRVTNRTDAVAISIHFYGTDISRVGSSVRRTYDLPIR
jgi:predicted metal-dependent enzyme (double-stranded beta helix superfamily)